MIHTEDVIGHIPEQDTVAGRCDSRSLLAEADRKIDLRIVNDETGIGFFLWRFGADCSAAAVIGSPSLKKEATIVTIVPANAEVKDPVE